MANQELVDYIKIQLSVNVSTEEIEKTLRETGWDDASIAESMPLAQAQMTPSPEKLPEKPKEQTPIANALDQHAVGQDPYKEQLPKESIGTPASQVATKENPQAVVSQAVVSQSEVSQKPKAVVMSDVIVAKGVVPSEDEVTGYLVNATKEKNTSWVKIIILGVIGLGVLGGIAFMAMNSLSGSLNDKPEAAQSKSNKGVLYDYVFNGPFDKAWECDSRGSCLEKLQQDKESGIYDKANLIFIKEIEGVYDKLAFLPSIHENDMYFLDELLKNVDMLAKDILTVENYELEKARDFSTFAQFVVLLLNNESYVQGEFAIFTDYTPLTQEQEDLYRAVLEDTGALPDPNDPRFDFLLNRSFSIMSDGSVEFSGPALPILVINETRIAQNLLTFASPFDLVNVNNEWKVDFMEPIRPADNARTMLLGVGDEDTYLRLWEEVEVIAELSVLSSPVFIEFKTWWEDSSVEEKIVFLSGAVSYELSDSQGEGALPIFFVHQIPVESNQILSYGADDRNSFFEESFSVAKNNGEWFLTVNKPSAQEVNTKEKEEIKSELLPLFANLRAYAMYSTESNPYGAETQSCDGDDSYFMNLNIKETIDAMINLGVSVSCLSEDGTSESGIATSWAVSAILQDGTSVCVNDAGYIKEDVLATIRNHVVVCE